MFPVILKIGPIVIYSQGIMIILAFLTSLFFLWKKGREDHFNEEELINLGFLILVSGLIGARIGFVFSHFNDFGLDIWQWFNFTSQPGWNFWGGLVLTGLILYFWTKSKDWSFFKLADILAISVSFGLGLIRVGNFLSGSLLSQKTSFVHPINLYQAILFFALAGLLLKLEKEYRTFVWYKNQRGEAEPGLIFSIWLASLGLIKLLGRFLISGRAVFLGLQVEQVFGLAAILTGSSLIYFLSGSNLTQFKFKKPKHRKKNTNKRFKKGLDAS